MNILINTPLLNSPALKEEFDNKILVLFLTVIIVLVILGVLFLDIIQIFQKPSSLNEERPSELPKALMYA